MSGIQSTRLINWLICLTLLATACRPESEQAGVGLPYYNTPDFTPVWVNDARSLDQTITHRIADFRFTDQTGQSVTQETVAGRVHVANFFFTACPSICPKMTNLLRAVQDTFERDNRVVLLSYSVTPWLDSVPRLRQYAQQKGVRATQWHLLTGERGKLYDLARRSYFAEEAIGFTRDSTEFLHTEHLILVDQNRRIRGVYNGTMPLEIDKLIGDIRVLLED
ncbi:MAG: SCO family protein [Cytophagales bacterium]|nr:MAG: SCO family protein [Cytophagales bacterium]